MDFVQAPGAGPQVSSYQFKFWSLSFELILRCRAQSVSLWLQRRSDSAGYPLNPSPLLLPVSTRCHSRCRLSPPLLPPLLLLPPPPLSPKLPFLSPPPPSSPKIPFPPRRNAVLSCFIPTCPVEAEQPQPNGGGCSSFVLCQWWDFLCRWLDLLWILPWITRIKHTIGFQCRRRDFERQEPS